MSNIGIRKTLEDAEAHLCSLDPCYFLNKYGFIRHALRGKIPFKLFKYQEDSLKDYVKHRRNVLLKSRQMGYSWLAAGYVLWFALFRVERDILLMSKKEDDAKELLHKVRFIYDDLPRFLKLGKTVDSASAIGFTNGSRIVSLPATEQSGRGFAGALVIIDEAAFIPWSEKVYGALRPTLSTGGSIILQSTAPDTGDENMFARILEEHKDNKFNRIVGRGKDSKAKEMIHWSENPERDDKWFEEERPGYTERQWQTEFEGNLLQSSRRVFDESMLKLVTQEEKHNPYGKPIVTPIEWKKGSFNETYCEEPIEGETYAVGVDTAEGLEKGDYSVAQVLKKSDGKQVAVYRSRIPVVNATEEIIELARHYNNALLGIEDNNVGIISIQIAKKSYRNLYKRKVHDKRTDSITEKIGWRTTKRSKPLMIRDLEMALRDVDIRLTDKITRRELFQYQYDEKGGTACPQGQQYFDDCVMSLAVAYQCLKDVPSRGAIARFHRAKAKRQTRIGKKVRCGTIGY